MAMLASCFAGSSGRAADADDTSPEARLERAHATLNRDAAGHVVEVLFHHHTELSDQVLTRLGDLQHLQRLGLGSPRFTDQHLSHIEDLRQLKSLGLTQAKISDEGLSRLAGLKSLETLQLDGCRQVTDKGLARLAGLTSLVELNLSNTGVSIEGLRQLAGRNLKVLKLPADAYVDDGLLPYLEAIVPQSDLDLSEWSLTDEGLVHLVNQQQLESLVLPGGWRREKLITDAGLSHLSGLVELQSLSLAETNIDGSGLRHLKGLSKLKSLDLAGTKLIDKHMVHLEQLGSLESLRLASCKQITDRGLASLVQLGRLTKLNLGVYPGNTKITDTGLVHVAELTQLQELHLTDMPVTDTGLKQLERLEKLELLWLDGCLKISDVGLASVATFEELSWVNLNDCPDITAAGVVALQASLPGCVVSHGTSITWMTLNGWWYQPTIIGVPAGLMLLLCGGLVSRRRSRSQSSSAEASGPKATR